MHRSFDRFRGKYTVNPIPRILCAAEELAFILTDVFLTFPIPVISQTCSNFAAPLKGDFVVVRRETEAAVTGSGERALSTIGLVSCLKAEENAERNGHWQDQEPEADEPAGTHTHGEGGLSEAEKDLVIERNERMEGLHS